MERKQGQKNNLIILHEQCCRTVRSARSLTKKRQPNISVVFSLVGLSGLEPPTPTLSGWCSNLLSYNPISAILTSFGGGNRVRTGDLLRARQALYQLSYTPIRKFDSVTILPPKNRLVNKIRILIAIFSFLKSMLLFPTTAPRYRTPTRTPARCLLRGPRCSFPICRK